MEEKKQVQSEDKQSQKLSIRARQLKLRSGVRSGKGLVQGIGRPKPAPTIEEPEVALPA
jgi:hypothetical protein